ncbi:MAG: hypothetical protein E4H00_04465 [Myxococcales bacterium]|nr:MAG: hypothetical protein E4H00_04465 [Myxococcales bacterium]
MSEPSTILMRQTDDDRTLIDPIRLADPEPPFEGSGLAPSAGDSRPSAGAPAEIPRARWRRFRAKLRGTERRALEVGVALALVLSLGSLAYQQWRASHALRRMIDDMTERGAATPIEELVGSSERVSAPTDLESRLFTSSGDLVSIDREEIETQGARLIAANNFEGALPRYRKLARLFPTEPVFRDVIVVLKAKLKCGDLVEAASPACP